MHRLWERVEVVVVVVGDTTMVGQVVGLVKILPPTDPQQGPCLVWQGSLQGECPRSRKHTEGCPLGAVILVLAQRVGLVEELLKTNSDLPHFQRRILTPPPRLVCFLKDTAQEAEDICIS